MKEGHLPRHIYSFTLRLFYAFGKKGFFDEVLSKIVSWANSISILDYKLRHNSEFKKRCFDPTPHKDIMEDEKREQ